MKQYQRLFFACLCVFTTSGLHAAGNPIKGKELFQQCVACHAIGEGAEHTVGPTLNHVFGRVAGAAEEYEYSEAMAAKGADENLLWDEKSLYIFLAGPERYVPGTKMAFAGLRTEKELKDLLSYLIDYSPAYEAESSQAVSIEAMNAATLPAQESADEEEAVPEFSSEYLAAKDPIALGGELWAKQCRHCHGNSAYPGKAPKLVPARYTPEFVFDRLTNGFRKMPAWKTVFSLDDRKAIVSYVLSNSFSP